MKHLKLFLLLSLIFIFSSCASSVDDSDPIDPLADKDSETLPVLEQIEITINNDILFIGDKVEYSINTTPSNFEIDPINIIIGDENIINNELVALSEGKTFIKFVTGEIEITKEIEVKRLLKPDIIIKDTLFNLVVGESAKINYELIDTNNAPTFMTESNLIELNEDGSFKALKSGNLVINIILGDILKTVNVNIVDRQKSDEEIINEVINSITIPDATNTDIYLPLELNGVLIDWSSLSSDLISDSGEVYFTKDIKLAILYATFIYNETEIDKRYYINIKPWSDADRLKKVVETVDIPETITENLNLQTSFKYDVKGIWTSSNENVITSSGIVNFKDDQVDLVLKLKLVSGEEFMEKEYMVHTIGKKKMNLHYFVERANDFNKKNLNNLELVDGKICLKEGEVYGYYDSEIYETLNFYELVASFASITSKEATCELLVKVRVGSTFSKYFTYGIWGLGRNNLYYNQKDTMARMDTDEVLIDTRNANAFQYRIILRRDSASCDSPKLSLVAVTMRMSDASYKYEVDTTNLPDFVDYDVPKVNQNVVPGIGGVICSATTSTMLLKWKGLDFSQYDVYENRYIANLVADRGHNNPTYGNWVYNTVTMSAYGFDSYVKHMTSWDELKWHLANVGPVGASIKGDAILYTTGGHLIVVRGYRVVGNTTYVICNDPNINERFGKDKDGNDYFVYYEFPLNVFMNFWRGTVYVIE